MRVGPNAVNSSIKLPFPKLYGDSSLAIRLKNGILASAGKDFSGAIFLKLTALGPTQCC
jgi:hypothetical protein